MAQNNQGDSNCTELSPGSQEIPFELPFSILHLGDDRYKLILNRYNDSQNHSYAAHRLRIH